MSQYDETVRREQLKLIYDYIKFHIALYLATPSAMGVLGNSFEVLGNPCFRYGLGLMISVYVVSGIHAAWFIGTHINERWDTGYLEKFEAEAFRPSRRIMHHGLYWLGLAFGLGGLAAAARLSCCA